MYTDAAVATTAPFKAARLRTARGWLARLESRAFDAGDEFPRRRIIGWTAGGLSAATATAFAFGVIPLGVAALLVTLLLGADVLAGAPRLRRPYALLIISLTLIDLSPLSIGDSTLRYYQPGSLLLPFCALGTRVHTRLRVGLFFALALFTVAQWLSLPASISVSDTVHVSAGQSYLLWLTAVVMLLLRRGVLTPNDLARCLLAGCTAGSLVALGQFGLALAGTPVHVFTQSGIPWPRPGGLMREPDWAGLIAAIGLLLVAAGGVVRGRWTSLPMGALHIAVLGLTAVRSVLVGLVVTALALAIFPRVPKRSRLVGLSVLACITAALLTVFATFPQVSGRFDPEAVTRGGADGGAANSRLAALELVLEEGPREPWTGHGAGSIAHVTDDPQRALLYGGGGELNGGHGSVNLFGTTFFDLGFPGLALIVAVVAIWLRAAWSSTSAYLLPVSLLLVATFNLTNGFRFGFVWVIMAACMVAPSKGSVGAAPLGDGEGGLPKDHEVERDRPVLDVVKI